MDGSAFRNSGLTEFFHVVVWLAVVGTVAIVGGLVTLLWWVFTHVSISWT